MTKTETFNWIRRAAKCHVCDAPATCIGVYEHPDDPPAFACDKCCGHGNEDGLCVRLDDALAADVPVAQ